MPIPEEFEHFWSAGERAHPQLERSRFLDAFAFGSSERMATYLAHLVLSGAKRATASLVWTYEHDRKPRPRPGDFSIVTTWTRQPMCIIETTAVEIVPFEQVSETFARAEGEDDGSLESWRRNHAGFFAGECTRIGRAPDPQMLVVCENFSVAYKPCGTCSSS